MTFWTYVGQIINFLIFVGVLYYLLYRPVRRIMQERKDAMEADLREAEEQRAEAERIREEAETKAKELEDKRDGILKEAREHAEEQRKEILDQAEDLARQRFERFRRIMEQERDETLEKIKGDLRDTIRSVAASALHDASQELADRAIRRVAELLDGLSDEDKEKVRTSVAEAENRVSVCSAGPLSPEQTERLAQIVQEKVGAEGLMVDVEEDASLIAGLEVTLGHIQLEAHWRDAIEEALKEEGSAT